MIKICNDFVDNYTAILRKNILKTSKKSQKIKKK